MVQDAVVSAELRVLPAQRVQAVRAGDDDLAVHPLDAFEQIIDRLDILRCQLLEQEFVARAPRRVAGAGLPVAEYEELDTGRREQLGNGFGGLLGAVIERARAAHPEQILEPDEGVDVLAVDRNVEADFVDPGEALLGVLAPRVALGLEVLVEPAEFGRKL